MKKLFTLLLSLLAPVFGHAQEQPQTSNASVKEIQQAFKNQRSDLQILGSGTVIKVLPDDVIGDKHQKFLLKLSATQTLLIAHNIDIAARIANLKEGDKVEFYGEYEWNERGGLIHWTHHDPEGRHVDGWLKHQGKIYQ
jgi:Protein of unknown function (DUF3465)